MLREDEVRRKVCDVTNGDAWFCVQHVQFKQDSRDSIPEAAVYASTQKSLTVNGYSCVEIRERNNWDSHLQQKKHKG